MKPHFFKNLAQAHAELKRLGIPTSDVKSVAAAQKAIDNSRTPNATKPQSVGKPIVPINPSGLPDSPIKPDDIQGLTMAAKAERDPSRKVELLSELSAKQYAAMQAEPDAIKKTDLMRAWQQSDKSLAYAKLAEREANPS